MLTVIFITRRNNILFIWLRIELNIIRVIPLLAGNQRGYRSEVVLKYFLVQAWGSIILIWSLVVRASLGGLYFQVILRLALFLKLGVVPFHLWFLRVIKVLDWNLFVLLSTLQKVLPIVIVSIFRVSRVLKAGVILCRLRAFRVASLKYLKLTIAVSSVFSLAWLLAGALGDSCLWLVYLGVYTLGLLTLLRTLGGVREGHTNLRVKFSSLVSKIIIFFSFIILAGLPPFIGFIGKMLLFAYLIELKEWALVVSLLFGAVWIIYVYVRVRFLALAATRYGGVLGVRGHRISYAQGSLLLMARLPRGVLLLLCIGVKHIKFWILRIQRNL